MFKKKTLVVSYIYSFDYSKEPVELNELMFKERGLLCDRSSSNRLFAEI